MHSALIAKRLKFGLASLLLGSAILVSAQPPITLEQFRADPKLTPATFMERFADFKFQLREDVQKPEVFLASRTGDCDDFAALAAMILREKGYTTRLVAVYMDREVHVVCHVGETRSYLDFNHRFDRRLVDTTGELEDIARKVSEDFKSPWHTASEFTYSGSGRQFVSTQFH